MSTHCLLRMHLCFLLGSLYYTCNVISICSRLTCGDVKIGDLVRTLDFDVKDHFGISTAGPFHMITHVIAPYCPQETYQNSSTIL